MFEVRQREPSQEFKNAWLAAAQFLQSKSGDGLNWIKADLTSPMAEHLSFRLGNQLFFIFIEAAEFNFQKMGKLFLEVADAAKATPCIMPMKKRIATYEPSNSGWGLVHAKSRFSIDPVALVSDELIEMSEWELHDFAIQVVKSSLTEQGKKILSSQSSLQIDPSIWFEESKTTHWVVVRAVKYPEKEATVPNNIDEIAQGCAHMGKKGFFASIAIAGATENSDDPFDSDIKASGNYLPLYRGQGMFVKFDGLNKNIT